jgi:hypothetical protein
MSITQGMAEPWGNFLLSSFRLKLKKLIKKIIRVIKRYIPIWRRKVLFKVNVIGHPFSLFSVSASVTGYPFESKEISLPVYGSLIAPFKTDFHVTGFPFERIEETLKIIGDTLHKVSSSLLVHGSAVAPVVLSIKCEGKRDLRQLIWEILEEEDEE